MFLCEDDAGVLCFSVRRMQVQSFFTPGCSGLGSPLRMVVCAVMTRLWFVVVSMLESLLSSCYTSTVPRTGMLVFCTVQKL